MRETIPDVVDRRYVCLPDFGSAEFAARCGRGKAGEERSNPNTREASRVLIPSTRHARRTRAYISTRYIPPPSSQSNPDRRLYTVPFWSAAAGSTGRLSGGLLRRRSQAFRKRLGAMGIRDRPTAPRSPWQNAHVERLVGSIRRECLDHLIVLNEAHLRRLLRACADYYNATRIHLSLGKDTPLGRPILRQGRIRSVPHMGGLHHSFVRM